MMGFTLSTKQTAVVHMVITAVVTTLMGMAPASGQSYSNRNALSTEELRQQIELACGHLKSSGSGEGGTSAYDQCKAQMAAANIGGTTSVTGGDERCQKAIDRYTDVRDKFIEACSRAGAGSPPGACRTRANKCQANRDSAMASFNDEEDVSKMNSEDLKNACEDRYSECPELARATIGDLREEKSRLEDTVEDRKDQIQDLQDQLQQQQEDTIRDQQSLQDAQDNLQNAVIEATEALEKRTLEIEAQMVEQVQKLRQQYEEIDQRYAQIRTTFNSSSDALAKEITSIEDKCEAEAEKYVQDLEAAKKTAKATGANVKKSTSSLSGAVTKRKKLAQERFDYCMQRKSVRNQRSDIANRRATLIKAMQDEQAMLEQRRQNLVTNIKEIEILAVKQKDQLAKQLSTRIQQIQQQLQKAQDRYAQQQQIRMQQMIQLQQQVAEKNQQLSEVDRERRLVKEDFICASRYKGRGTYQSTADGELSSVDYFMDALGFFRRMEEECSRATAVCSGQTSGSGFNCGAEVKSEKAAGRKRGKSID